MFLRSACQSSPTAFHVSSIMSTPFWCMKWSFGRYLAQSVRAKRDTPVYVPELNSDRVFARSKRSMISYASCSPARVMLASFCCWPTYVDTKARIIAGLLYDG